MQDLKSFVSRADGHTQGILRSHHSHYQQWRAETGGPNNAKCRMHDGHSCILHETENPINFQPVDL